MYAFLLILHLLICLALIGVVLIQSGKGGGLAGGAFGGSAQTVFGGRGATDVVTRATMILGGLFFVTSVSLALMTSGIRGPSRSLVQEAARKTNATAPQQPGTAPHTPASPGPTSPVPAGGSAPTGGSAPASGPTPQPPAGGK